MKFRYTHIADGLGAVFIGLGVEHNAASLAKFETSEWLGWFLAIGLDLAIAFAAFTACNPKLDRMGRGISIAWLVGLLAASYLLNVAHYQAYKAGDWAIGLAAIFPLSLALLGAVRQSLVKLDAGRDAESSMLKDAQSRIVSMEAMLKDTSEKMLNLENNAQNNDAEYSLTIAQMQNAHDATLASMQAGIDAQTENWNAHRQELIEHYETRLASMQNEHDAALASMQNEHLASQTAMQKRIQEMRDAQKANAENATRTVTKPDAKNSKVSSIRRIAPTDAATKDAGKSERARLAAAARWGKSKEEAAG